MTVLTYPPVCFLSVTVLTYPPVCFLSVSFRRGWVFLLGCRSCALRVLWCFLLGGAARVAEALVRFPNNVACNSSITSSGFDIRPLELQCLWAVLKTGRGELRATFMWMRRACAAGAHAVVCA